MLRTLLLLCSVVAVALASDCCTDLLIAEKSESNWKHWEKTDFYNSTFTMSGTIWNGYPVWQDSWEELSLWHENGFWLMGEMEMVHYKSETFADCPELVESWTTRRHGGLSTDSIEKITCQNTAEK